MFEIFIGILGVFAFLNFAIHLLCFYYLEISNDYDFYPYFRFSFEFIAPYTKKVKLKDVPILKICNVTLAISGYCMLSTVLLAFFNVVFI